MKISRKILSYAKYACMFLCISTKPSLAISTEMLAEACKSKNTHNAGFCIGYIGGIYEGILLNADYENQLRSVKGKSIKPPPWCVPEGTQYTEMSSEYLKFLDTYPNFIDNSVYAEISVYAFFSDIYGCQK